MNTKFFDNVKLFSKWTSFLWLGCTFLHGISVM